MRTSQFKCRGNIITGIFYINFGFNDFNTSLILKLIKISTLKIVQLLRYFKEIHNLYTTYNVIISNLLFLFPQ